MSVFNDSQVQLILADYASTDSDGKLNAVGAGISMMGLGPQGTTPPLHVAVVINTPAKYNGEEFALTVDLIDAEVGSIVQLPGPTGNLDQMRIQQMIRINPVQLPPQVKKPQQLTSQSMIVLGFPTGLPLKMGHSYEWKARIDGQSRPGWRVLFHVLDQHPGPILGGPAGANAIEGVEPISADVPEEAD